MAEVEKMEMYCTTVASKNIIRNQQGITLDDVQAAHYVHLSLRKRLGLSSFWGTRVVKLSVPIVNRILLITLTT